ncbi:receptor-like protein kinase [Gossypium australe]|uniref:Receptor-like protein kinase n=1 Tax=Gossypium australe TaxID=47621 RepID=A0A5B6W6I6_9ROSI|nr:receptor-like protein kinase [Gossypium australe]
MTYGEEPIKILARAVKQFRNKGIALVKVLWQRHRIEEATWEPEKTMRNQYPNLFTDVTPCKTTSGCGIGIVPLSNSREMLMICDMHCQVSSRIRGTSEFENLTIDYSLV